MTPSYDFSNIFVAVWFAIISIPVWLMLVISAYGYLDYFILKTEFQTKIGSPSAKIVEYWINNICEWQSF